MHSLLETYLSQVAAHLGTLPAKRRMEEMREMRTHLENAVIVNRGMGQSEDEAARAAVAQFGAAQDLGHDVVMAWRRGEALNRRSLLGAAACAVASAFLVTRLTPHLLPLLPPTPARGFVQPPFSAWLWAGWVLWLMPTFLLVGGISGFLFPRRAALGAAAGVTAFLSYFLLAAVLDMFHWPKISHTPVFGDLYWLSSIAAMDFVFLLFASAAAWAVGRWRDARISRARLARQ